MKRKRRRGLERKMRGGEEEEDGEEEEGGEEDERGRGKGG